MADRLRGSHQRGQTTAWTGSQPVQGGYRYQALGRPRGDCRQPGQHQPRHGQAAQPIIPLPNSHSFHNLSAPTCRRVRAPRFVARSSENGFLRRKVASGPAVLVAKGATSTIPIVFFFGGDPVAAGWATSLARPGGNLTGFSILVTELMPKRLELISELVPQAGVIALLVNPNSADAERQTQDVQEAARAKRVQLIILKAGTESEIDAAFGSLLQSQAGALLVGADPFFNSRREKLIALSARFAVPAIYEWRAFAELGGLISYGPSQTGLWRQVGIYAGRILKGAKPADLPVQQPTTFELVVNRNTAKALGLTV